MLLCALPLRIVEDLSLGCNDGGVPTSGVACIGTSPPVPFLMCASSGHVPLWRRRPQKGSGIGMKFIVCLSVSRVYFSRGDPRSHRISLSPRYDREGEREKVRKENGGVKCFLFLSWIGKNSGALWEDWSLANSAFVVHDVSLDSWNAMPYDLPNVSWATRGVSGYAKYPGWSLRWLT